MTAKFFLISLRISAGNPRLSTFSHQCASEPSSDFSMRLSAQEAKANAGSSEYKKSLCVIEAYVVGIICPPSLPQDWKKDNGWGADPTFLYVPAAL